MNPKKALYFSICIRMLMVFFCISICFVKFIESDDETKQGMMEKEKRDLVLAAEKADTESCKKLMERGVPLDGVLADGSTPLHLAALNSVGDESYGLLKEMLYFFANPTVKDHEGRMPMHRAATNTKNIERINEVIAFLMLYGADINAENNYGRAVLSDLVTLQSADNVENFLEYWGSLCSERSIEKAKELAGSSAGLGLGNTEIYKRLVKKRTTSELMSASGIHEVIMKVLKGEWEEALKIAEKEHAFGVCVPEKYGKLSLLFIALLRGEKKLAKALLEKGVSMDYTDSWGRNVLHIITGSNLLDEREKIKLLEKALSKGAKSREDSKGNTIIHTAVKNNYVSLVMALKSGYAEQIAFGHKNKQRDRPVDIALRYGKTKMIDLLGTN